jgi:hypothetical protein
MELNTQTVAAIGPVKDQADLIVQLNAQLTAIQKNFEAIKQAVDNDVPRSKIFSSGAQ